MTITSGATIASSSTLASMFSTIMRLRSSWPSSEPVAPRAVMRWKCTETPTGAKAIISASTVGFPGGTRNPSRALQPIILSRPQCRAIVNILQLQGLCQQPLLQRTADRPLDVSAHRIEPERIGVVAQDRALLLAVLTREVQVSEFGAPSPLISDFLGPPKRLVQLQRHPRVLAQDAVLHDHVMIGLEETSLAEI